jgi:hypothetical protein
LHNYYYCYCWSFSCWYWYAVPPSDDVPLLPVAASGLGCLVMGGIRIMSFVHQILWMRATARVVCHPHQLVQAEGSDSHWLTHK